MPGTVQDAKGVTKISIFEKSTGSKRDKKEFQYRSIWIYFQCLEEY